jgi:hypothetical protein
VVDIQVTTVGGTSAAADADHFRYVPPPTVGSVTPGRGPTAGGTVVTVTGTDLDTASTVTFGGLAASFTVLSPTQLQAVAPAHDSGTVDIQVTTVGGTSPATAADRYRYIGPPVVSGLLPSSGSFLGGDTVRIFGRDLDGATSVVFGPTAAKSFTVISPTEVDAVDPLELPGTVDVRVTTPMGTSPATPADRFSYRII